jgi:hypothetical protein
MTTQAISCDRQLFLWTAQAMAYAQAGAKKNWTLQNQWVMVTE